MNRFLIVLFSSLCFLLHGQDAYHTELVSSLSTTYGLENGVFVINDSEQANVEDIAVYGNVSQTERQVNNANYTIVQQLRVNSVGNNQWDAGYTIRNKTQINSGDIVLLTFVARSLSGASELFLFGEDASTFEKEAYTTVNLEPDWNTYYLPMRVASNYSPNRLVIGFHLASLIQEFDIAGFTAINYGSTYSVEDFPSSFGTGAYDGSESDAEWRTRAADRIETLRKADMNVEVVDASGNPVEGATVAIEMEEHDFGFGSAFVACRFPGNNCFNTTYVNKIFDLDGEGHSFNVGVTENALKWDGWEEEWIGTPEETVNAIEYLTNQGIAMRGHTLVWPGYTNLPDDISDNRTNLSYVRNRINARLESMILHPVLGDLITEWDVLNEVTQNRDIESIFNSDPAFSTGREIYPEIFNKVKELNPDSKIYINDYVVLSGGGSSQSVVNRYKTYLDELDASDATWEGIGFQCHIGAQPTSIIKLENTLDEFYDRYNKRVKITEYDISNNVDEQVQARYMADFLTMIYSHPSVDAFIMWGFWDGNHWKGNAPMFDINWNLKPSGQAFIDKVFKDWWTDDSGLTDSNGIASFRGFKGKYTVTITTPNGEAKEAEINLKDDLSFTINTEGIVSTADLKSQVSIYPNPASDYLNIKRNNAEECQVIISDISGRVLYQSNHSSELIQVKLPKMTDSLILVNLISDGVNHTERVLLKTN